MAMGTEAANLFVKVTGDISDAHSKMGQIGDKVTKTSGVMKGAISTALGFGAASIAMAGFGSAVQAVGGGVIGMNAELETSTLQFTTLMGDSDRAKKHVESLFDFAAKTPFETGPIIKASATMQKFGGDALNTKKNLGLFGDAAAATGAPIDDISFWMSRAYAAIEGGQPFGEARMRLMELGVITPQTATKLEKLSESGADSKKVWGALSGELDKYGGAMEAQAGTFDGMMSTFTDGVNMMLAKAGKPLFDMLKQLLEGVNNLMSSDAFTGAMASAAAGLGAAFGLLGDALSAIGAVLMPVVDGIGQLVDAMLSGGDVTEDVQYELVNLGETFGNLAKTIGDAVVNIIGTVYPMLAELAMKIGNFVLDSLPLLTEALPKVGQAIFDYLLNEALPGLANALGPMIGKMISWITTDVVPKLGDRLPLIGEAILSFLEKNLPVLAGKLVEWAAAFLTWILPMIPPLLVQLAIMLAKIVAFLVTQAAPRLLGIAVKVGMALLEGLFKVIKTIAPQIGTWFTSVLLPAIGKFVGGIGKAAGELGKSLVTGFVNALTSLPGKVLASIKRAFQSINFTIGPFHVTSSGVSVDLPKIDIPGFATGSWNVPFTGPALIHKGEIIIPADLANRLRSGYGGQGGTALRPVGGGGNVAVVVNIGDFHGTEENIRRLSEKLGETVRYSTLRTSAGT